MVGVLRRSDLLVALAQREQSARIAEAMQQDVRIVDAGEMLGSAFSRLQKCEYHTLPVVRDGRLVGLVTMDDFGEFVSIQSVLEAARA